MDKKQKIFLCTIVSKFQKIYLQWSKTDLSKETKKEILRRDTLPILVAAVWRCTVLKGS